MQTLIVEVDTSEHAKELSTTLSSMNFVRKVTSVRKRKGMIAALQEQESVKTAAVSRKNKAMAKYL